MKKVIFAFIAAAFSLALNANPSHPLIVKDVYPGISGPNLAIAYPFNIQYDFDLSGFVLYDDCTGELVDLSGAAHIVIHGVYNGKISNFTYNFNAQGAKGIGESTGNNYVITDNFKLAENYSFAKEVLTFTVMETFKITTKGAANNFYVTYAFKYAYNFATGTFTVTHSRFDYGCR